MPSDNKKRMPTIRDVAQRAGVAPITVSRVMNNNGYISEATRARVEAAIQELNYVPNSLSRIFRSKQTGTIALLISDITNPFWTTLTRGVEDICNTHNINVILSNTDEKPEKLAQYVRVLLQKQIDGFLLVPTGDDAHLVTMIQRRHVPVVLLDRTLPDVDAAIVRSDTEKGAYLGVQHLIRRGHQRIGMIAGPQTISTTHHRTQGYQRALQDAGIPVDENLQIYGDSYRDEAGYQITLALMEQQNRPTALFAFNNVLASGALRALYELGLAVPDDVSIVSFDDLPFNYALKPFMTVVAQSPYQLGQQAAQLLVDILQGHSEAQGHDIILPVELIVRESCAPPKAI